jgi:hypothetical protein
VVRNPSEISTGTAGSVLVGPVLRRSGPCGPIGAGSAYRCAARGCATAPREGWRGRPSHREWPHHARLRRDARRRRAASASKVTGLFHGLPHQVGLANCGRVWSRARCAARVGDRSTRDTGTVRAPGTL